MFLDVNQLHGVPDARQAAGDHWFADFLFQQRHVGDRWPTGAGDENAVGVASLGVEPFGDFVRGMNRKISELGVFPDAVTGNLQDLESRSFEIV